jgi:Ca2+-binding RTX toxin-like protein
MFLKTIRKITLNLNRMRHIPRRDRAIASAVIETLEQRRMLASSSITSGLLTVTGDTTGDNISIQVSSGTLTVTDSGNNIGTYSPSSQVTSILVNADTGDDSILIDPSVSSSVPTTLNGEGGIDTITGGLGNDSMVGGDGNDIYDFTGSGNLGTDKINETGNQDTDTIDFTGFSVAASLNLSLTTAQTVASSHLSLQLSSGSGIENVTGANLGDSLVGNSRDNVIYGGDGGDTIRGGDGNDTIHGNDGADLIYGDNNSYGSSGGNDSLIGDGANDTISGEAGNDYIEGDADADTLYGDFSSIGGGSAPQGNDTIRGGGGNDLLQGDATGSTEGQDSLMGDDGADTLYGDGNGYGSGSFPADDTLEGGADNDTLQGDDGADTYIFFSAFSSSETLGTDTINNSSVNVTPKTLKFSGLGVSGSTTGITLNIGQTTQQTVVTNRLNLIILGNAEVGNVIGSNYKDSITGNSLANVLRGGDEDDTILGGAGNDSLYGEAGSDSLSGGDDNDTLDGGSQPTEADTMKGDAGTGDTVTYAGRSNAVTADIDGVADDGESGENDLIDTDVENLTGGDAGDTLTGSSGANVLHGGSGGDNLDGGDGADTLYGDDGADSIHGGAGADIIYGGAGQDSLYGDDGNDVFHTLDGEADAVINGGNGTDTATDRDTSLDTNLISIENS